MDKIKCFEKKMSYIQNPDYLVDFQYLVSNLPDYFLKFQHLPQESIIRVMLWELKGLLRHTKLLFGLLTSCYQVIGDKYTE